MFCVFLDSVYLASINHRAKAVYISPVIQSPCSEPAPLSNTNSSSKYFPWSKSTQSQIPDTYLVAALISPKPLKLFNVADPKLFTLPCFASLALPVLGTQGRLWSMHSPSSFLPPDQNWCFPVALCVVPCLAFLRELWVTLNFSFYGNELSVVIQSPL